MILDGAQPVFKDLLYSDTESSGSMFNKDHDTQGRSNYVGGIFGSDEAKRNGASRWHRH